MGILFIKESDSEYHAKAQSGEYVSSHLLAKFRECPLLYHQIIAGLIDQPDSTAYRVGRAVHKLALEGNEAFLAAYAIGGPINEKTGKPYGADTKAAQAWLKEQGKNELLTTEETDLVKTMSSQIKAHAEAARLLAQGEPEVILRTPIDGVDCQAKLDWFNPGHGIVDLKTCDNLSYFEYDAKRFGYGYQLAFYWDILCEASKENIWSVSIIAIEKCPPYRCGVWHYPEEVLAPYIKSNRLQLVKLKACRDANVWPTGYEQAITLSA